MNPYAQGNQKQFYLQTNGKTLGPFGVETLKRMLNMGTLTPTSLTSVDLVHWNKISDFPELLGKPALGQYATQQPPPEPQRSPEPPEPRTRELPPDDDAPRKAEKSSKRRSKARASRSSFTKPYAERRYEFLNRKLASRYFHSLFAILLCVVLTLLMVVFALLPDAGAATLIKVIQIVIVAVAIISFFYSIWQTIMFFWAFWASIPKKFSIMSPDLAASLLFVPVWGMYWIFVVIYGGAQCVNDALVDRSPENRTLKVSVSLAGTTSFFVLVANILSSFSTYFVIEAVDAGLGDDEVDPVATLLLSCCALLLIVTFFLLYSTMYQMRRAAEPLNDLAEGEFSLVD